MAGGSPAEQSHRGRCCHGGCGPSGGLSGGEQGGEGGRGRFGERPELGTPSVNEKGARVCSVGLLFP